MAKEQHKDKQEYCGDSWLGEATARLPQKAQNAFATN
jgi:hypothetical protein